MNMPLLVYYLMAGRQNLWAHAEEDECLRHRVEYKGNNFADGK
jgi:hypothetical protein